MRKLLIVTAIATMLLLGALFPLVSAGPIEFGHTWGTADFDRATAVVVDSSGNVFLAGSTYNPFTGDQSVFVLKFDPLGNFLWNRVMRVGVNSTGDLALAPGGDVFFLGQLHDASGAASVFIARISSAGNLVWAKDIPEIFYPTRIASDASTGGFFVTSHGSSTASTAVSAFNPDGSVRWARVSSGIFIDPAGLAVNTFQGPVLNYHREGDPVGIASFDSGGSLLAQRYFNPYPSYVTPQDVAAGPAGDIFSLATSSDGSFFLTHFNGSLDPSWTQRVQGLGFYDYPGRLVLMPDGTVNTLGSSFMTSNWTQSTNLYHLGANGAILGAIAYVNPVNSGGLSTGLQVYDGATLGNGGIVMAGTTSGVPPMNSQSVTPTSIPANATWLPDSVTWSAATLTLTDFPLAMSDPTVPVDDFGVAAGYQAWYGVTNVPSSKLTVTVKVSQSSPTSPTVSFSLTVSGGRKPYTYAWSFGDGTSGTGATPTHTYPGTGQFLAQVTVKDSGGLVGYGHTIVTVQGPPTILAILQYPPTNASAGDYVSFYADVIDADGGTIVTYQWSYGDGSSDVTPYPSTSHIYYSPGNYTLTLTVTDGDQGLSSSMSMAVTIVPRPDQPPVASFYWSPYNPTVNATVVFYGYYSYDPDGYITNYSWSFGDGSTFNSTSYYAFHSYALPGNFTVTLTVMDNAGQTRSLSLSLFVVPDLPPVAYFWYDPYVPVVNQTVSFNAGYYSYDPDGYIVSWLWDFGDGASGGGNSSTNRTGNETDLGPFPYHVYTHFGSYVVTLTVVDNAGLRASANRTIHVDAPPVAVITPARAVGKMGTLLVFSANASYDPDDNITSYVWSFNDGLYASGPWVTHVFANPGQYTVRLYVMDSYGISSVATLDYPVTIPKPPVAIIAWSPSRPIAGQTTVTFDGTNSLDPDGAITTYIWEFGDGIVGRGKTVTHMYANAGTHTVELVVLDEDGMSDRDVQTITVVATSKGTVTASSVSAPQAGARVTLTQGGAVVLELETSADGTFSLGDMAPGTYAMTISKEGYRTYEGTLVWDGINGDLGTFRLELLQVSPNGSSFVQLGMIGILAAGAAVGGLVTNRLRRRRREGMLREGRR